MVAISSWGRVGSFEHNIHVLTDENQTNCLISNTKPGIAYGMGRSYGDSCLNPNGTLWKTTSLDHFINFNQKTGILSCEAGVLLKEIQQLVVPHGWMLPVTPGTQLVTVGGAIANDVHGKNHHIFGSFGDNVRHITLIRTNGDKIECGPTLKPDWFAATVGGVGLTGIISKANLQLRRINGPWLETETIPYANFDEFFQLADESENTWEHTVSWFDCLSKTGRGLFMRANHSDISDRLIPIRKKHSIPVTPPISLVNQLSLRMFNYAYFHINKRKNARSIVHYEPFFYPLDNLLEWNRMYGPKGFYQYQCVIPHIARQESINAIHREIVRSGLGSFLAVLKTFGNRCPVGMLSFPQPGATLALDFPNQGTRTLKLFSKLDAIVREAGGRIYLAKDLRMPVDLFQLGYPQLPTFLSYRDPGISSALSRRLIGI